MNLVTTPVYFSHRSKAGISIGATVDNGRVYLAACFTNDGLARSGKLHKERRDKFSRSRAREILVGRLQRFITDFAVIGKTPEEGKFYPVACHPIPDNFDLGKFMSEMRKFFKPDPKEETCDVLGDPVFLITEKWEDISEEFDSIMHPDRVGTVCK